ncbi:MAG: hypothetical protein JNM39_06995 [Bdellovibrionaceae bacterium]|nr:hypothetical protein [Pseudobdellovibrionaceae bacterium]
MNKQQLLIIFAFCLQAGTTWSQIYTGAVSAAAGGTGRASVEPGSASFLNPAMMVHQKGQQIFTAKSQDEFAIGLTDNSEDSLIPTSVSYWQKSVDNGTLDGTYKLQDFRLSFAEFASTYWAVGLTAHVYQAQSEEKTWNQGNLDFGVMVTPVPEVGLAVVFYDLGQENSEIPEKLKLSPRIGLGFNHLYRDYFRSRLDLVSGPEQNFRRSTVMVGFESYLNQWILARFGMSSNTYLKQDLSSFGLGLDLPRFRINYAYQFVLNNSKDQRHAIDIVIPL